MLNWKFVEKRFLRPWNDTKDELCAPAVGIIGDTMKRAIRIILDTNVLVDAIESGGPDVAKFATALKPASQPDV